MKNRFNSAVNSTFQLAKNPIAALQKGIKSLPHLPTSADTHLPLSQKIAMLNPQLAPEIRLQLGDQQDIHDRESQTVIVWLARPDKRNAMSFSMMHKLIMIAHALQTWREVRAVILAGEGKSFCTGIDLADLNNKKNLPYVAWQLLKPSQSLFQKVCLVWQDLGVPVLAVTHGHCLGAGLQLALAADFRFSTPDCEFAIMEAKWGLVPDMGLTQSGFGVLRADVIKQLAMTARTFNGTQALAYGVVTEVVDEPMRAAEQLAAELATRSPDAVAAAKAMVNAMYAQPAHTLYQEKLWQIKMLISKNRPLAVKKAKDSTVVFLKRQF